MKILRNYILKEFFGPLFVSLAVLTLIMLLGNLVRLADLIINKGVDLFSVSKLFLYLIPSLLIYTLPLAVLVAVLLSVSRLSSDNEIIAVKASGVNIMRLVIAPLLTVGLILSLILFVFNDRIIPYANFATRRTLKTIGLKNPAAAFEAGTFINAFDRYIIFVHRIEDNKLHHIRIYEPQADDKPARTIIAREGEFVPIPETGGIKLKLSQGSADEPDLTDPGRFYKLHFNNLFLNLVPERASGREVRKRPKDMTFAEINQKIQEFKASGIETTPLLTELNRRIALAFSVLIFIPLACGLSLLTGKREKSINVSMAFGVTIIYYLLLLAANTLSLQGYVPAPLAMWLPNITLAAVALPLVIKCAY